MRIVLLVAFSVVAVGCPWPPAWLGGGTPTPSSGSPPAVPTGTRFVMGPRSDTACGSVDQGTLFNSQLAPLSCGFVYMGDGTSTVPPSRLLGETTKEWKASCNNGICALFPKTAAEVGAYRCTDKGCQLDPRAPIYNAGLSSCVQHIVQAPVTGTLDAVVGDVVFTLSLASTITVTGNAASPCPACSGGTCASTATNAGATCTDFAGSNFECIPQGPVLTPLGFDATFSNTGQYTRPLPLGFFCPGQINAGAFGFPTADNIRTTGLATRALENPIPYKARINSIFCVAASGNLLVDGALGLPGPGAVTIPVTFELDP